MEVIFQIIQYNIPSIYFKNPKVYLKPRSRTIISKKRNPLTEEMEEVFIDGTKAAKTQENQRVPSTTAAPAKKPVEE